MKKILPFSVLLLILCIAFYFFLWRPKQHYVAPIQVGAVHMKYACGDCSLEMKVLSVNSSKFDFLIGEEIFPVTTRIKSAELCSLISHANYQTAFNEKDTGLQFNIAGNLHRYKEIFSARGCGAVRCFEVDSIQYGSNPWVKF